MKHPCNYLFILLFLLLLPLLHACNGDVFVDEIKVPFTEATLSGDGDTLTLRFNTSKWQLNQAYHGEYGDTYTHYFAGDLYTLDGTNMGRTNCMLSQKGKIVVDYPPYELTFIRPNDRELQIILGDNPTKESFDFNLSVGDKDYFQNEEIRLTQQPGSGYVIDRIEYDPVPKEVRTLTMEDYYLVSCNFGDKPEEHTYDLNEEMKRWFYLSCDANLQLVGKDGGHPTITAPSADISQGVKPGTDYIDYFQYGSTLLTMNVEPPFVRTLTLQPGYTSIIRISEYDVYSTGYTLHLRNVKTGKHHAVQGEIESRTPTGTIAFYLRHQEDNEEEW